MIANTCFVAALSVAVLSVSVSAGNAISGLPVNKNTAAIHGEKLSFTLTPKNFDHFDGNTLQVAVKKEAYKPWFGTKKNEQIEMCKNPTAQPNVETRTVAVSCDLSKDYANDDRKLQVIVEESGEKYESVPFFGKFADPSLADKVQDKAQEKAQEGADTAEKVASDAADAGKDTATTLKDKTLALATTVGDKVVEAKDSVVQYVSKGKETGQEKGQEMIDSAKDSAKDTVQNVSETVQDEAKDVTPPTTDAGNAASSIPTNFLLTFAAIGVAATFTLLL